MSLIKRLMTPANTAKTPARNGVSAVFRYGITYISLVSLVMAWGLTLRLQRRHTSPHWKYWLVDKANRKIGGLL